MDGFVLKTEHIVAVVVGVVVLHQVYGRVLRSYFTRTYTSVPDLPSLGTPRKAPRELGTAVICGGSIGGLLAARVCTDHFERVVVIEPEGWTFTTEASEPPNLTTRLVDSARGTYNAFEHKRSRIYQYTAIHGYQALLTIVLRKLFPGFEDEAKNWGLTVGIYWLFE
ncbi:hypothetical protein AURDEDRAFT_164240 [Auricularia subglabra TFB-10046 SS5]|nr:hypothetical protein AURDEDRAFT_164240 [Auricularia subglabra TFB-10046 SS5]